MLVASSVLAQKQVSGNVSSETNDSLPGVTVVVKGTGNGVITDFDGNYTILNVPEDAILVYSFLGYDTIEIIVGSQTSINAVLKEGFTTLDDVVVVGYGTQKLVNVTGSVSGIDSKDIENRAVSNVSTLLAGQISGLTVIQKSGRPGAGSAGTLRIRGIGTLGDASKSNPLIMVDGVEGSLQDVNVNDIESVSVLKDAASAAIYGVRAANGVVLVTTKKGRIGKPVITYSGGYGTQEAFKIPKRVDSYTYALMYNQARENDGSSIRYSNDDLEKFRTGSSPMTHANIDHFKKRE